MVFKAGHSLTCNRRRRRLLLLHILISSSLPPLSALFSPLLSSDDFVLSLFLLYSIEFNPLSLSFISNFLSLFNSPISYPYFNYELKTPTPTFKAPLYIMNPPSHDPLLPYIDPLPPLTTNPLPLPLHPPVLCSVRSKQGRAG
ncbi:hypothetical protein Dimus_009340 [Dionaea muscipula]